MRFNIIIINDEIQARKKTNFILFQTTYSAVFALYHLARNTAVQEKLRSEAAALLTNPTSPITAETLRNAIYTKVVIKETLRLNPISVGIGRILQTDVVLSGYRVPKGVVYFINKLFFKVMA